MGAVESGDYNYEVVEQPRAEHAGLAAKPPDYDAFADFAKAFSGTRVTRVVQLVTA